MQWSCWLLCENIFGSLFYIENMKFICPVSRIPAPASWNTDLIFTEFWIYRNPEMCIIYAKLINGQTGKRGEFWWAREYVCNSSYHHHHVESSNMPHRCHILPGRVRMYHRISVICFIYVPGSVLFPLLLCSLWCVLHYDPKAAFCCLHVTQSHYQHRTNLSENIEHKMPIECILSSVRLRSCSFPQLSLIHYMGLCILSLPIFRLMLLRIYGIFHIIVIIKSELWIISHCLRSGHEIMVCAECLAMFLPHLSVTWLWITTESFLSSI